MSAPTYAEVAALAARHGYRLVPGGYGWGALYRADDNTLILARSRLRTVQAEIYDRIRHKRTLPACRICGARDRYGENHHEYCSICHREIIED